MNQTNWYAEEVMGAEAYASWKTISEEDVRAFIGFSILMSINQQSSMDDYWKKDPIHNYKPIAQRISRDRFIKVTQADVCGQVFQVLAERQGAVQLDP